MTRTYAKIDVNLPWHPKFVDLPPPTCWTFVAMILYSKRFISDGRVPTSVAHGFSGPKAVEQLVDRGVVFPDAGDYVIRDWHEWNVPRAEIERRRQHDAERKRSERGSETDDDRTARSSSRRVPVSLSSVLSTDGGSGGKDPGFDRVWEAFPAHYSVVRAYQAWSEIGDEVDHAAILAGAERYRDDPNRTAAFTKHLATWLYDHGWKDPPLPNRLNGKVPRRKGDRAAKALKKAGRS